MSSQLLEIDFDYGMQQLSLYLQDLMFLESGGKYKDLGIAERRKAAMPTVIVPGDSAAGYSIVDRWSINSDEIPHRGQLHC